MTESPRTVGGLLAATEGYLSRKGTGQPPRRVAEWLLARLLRCKPLDLHLKRDQVLSEKMVEALRRGVKRVAAGEPVQYVVAETEFMGHTFKVDRRALIPRPETELLVEEVLNCPEVWRAAHPAIMDVGTGSGCILISLALARPQGLYVGLDLSPEAVALARENAQALGVQAKIGFAAADVAATVEPETVDAAVANLPYVETEEWEKLPRHIREHEPREALDGGPDGLRAIEGLVQDAAIVLKPGGRLFSEIGARQAERVRGMLSEAGFTDVRVRQDLAGLDRVVTAVLPALGREEQPA